MEELWSWIRSIAVFLVLSSLLVQMLPSEGYRRYLRFFAGLVSMLLVCRPLLQLGGWEEELAQKAEHFSVEFGQAERLQNLRLAEGEYQRALREQYEAVILEQVEELAEAEGFGVLSCEPGVEWEPESPDFGRVKSLRVVVMEDSREAGAIAVEPVQLGTEETAGESLLSPLRRELMRLYELPESALTLVLVD